MGTNPDFDGGMPRRSKSKLMSPERRMQINAWVSTLTDEQKRMVGDLVGDVAEITMTQCIGFVAKNN